MERFWQFEKEGEESRSIKAVGSWSMEMAYRLFHFK